MTAVAAAWGRRYGLLVLASLLGVVVGCATTGTGRSSGPTPTSAELAEAVVALRRPLPGPLVALYRLRVPSTGGLRLSVIAEGDRGRMTVSENLGGALAVLAWDGERIRIFDLKEGCRSPDRDRPTIPGMEGLPMDRAILLMGGRLPVISGDVVRPDDGKSTVEIDGPGWNASAGLAFDPVRILSVRGEGWSVELGDHTSSLPGTLRFETGSDQWAELELVRLQWKFEGEWPPLPDFPECPR